MKSIIEQASSIAKAIEKAWNQAEQPKEFSIKIFEKEERNFFGMTTKPAKIGIFFGDKPIIHEKPAQKPRPEIKECRPTQKQPQVTKQEPSSFAPSFAKSFGGHSKATADKAPARPVAQQKPSFFAKATADTAQPKPQQPSTFAPTSPKQGSLHRQGFGGHDEGHSKASTNTSADTAKPRQQQNTPEKTAQSQQTATPKQAERPRRAPAVWTDAMVKAAHEWLNKTLQLMNKSDIQFNSEVAGKNLKITFNTSLAIDAAHEKQLFRSFAHLIMSSLRNQYKQEIRDLKVILLRQE